MSTPNSVNIQRGKIWALIILSIVAAVSLLNGVFEPFRDKPQKASSVKVQLEILRPLPQRTTLRTEYKEWKRNPLIPDDYDIDSGHRLVLHGIAWDPAYPKAIINDDIYAVGDEVDGKAILEIGADRVILQGIKKKMVLTIEGVTS